MRTPNTRTPLVALVLTPALVLTAAVLGCLAPAASASINCRYVAAGPAGPPGNRLEIRAKRFEEVVALLPGNGVNIRVMDDRRMKPLGCIGGRPTMVNLDLIVFTAGRGALGSSFFVADAPNLGPGASFAEGKGTGIGIVVKGRSISFGIGGSQVGDSIRMGMDGKSAAIDFSPELFVVEDGIDARIYAGFASILVRGSGGDDLIAGSSFDYSQTSLDGPLRKVPTTIYGEQGSDQIAGGNYLDYLDGGPGDDLLIGAAGSDQLFGGGGKDEFWAGPGRDEIDAIDRRSGEVVQCGRGKDLARMDLKDNDRDCESFRFP